MCIFYFTFNLFVSPPFTSLNNPDPVREHLRTQDTIARVSGRTGAPPTDSGKRIRPSGALSRRPFFTRNFFSLGDRHEILFAGRAGRRQLSARVRHARVRESRDS